MYVKRQSLSRWTLISHTLHLLLFTYMLNKNNIYHKYLAFDCDLCNKSVKSRVCNLRIKCKLALDRLHTQENNQ